MPAITKCDLEYIFQFQGITASGECNLIMTLWAVHEMKAPLILLGQGTSPWKRFGHWEIWLDWQKNKCSCHLCMAADILIITVAMIMAAVSATFVGLNPRQDLGWGQTKQECARKPVWQEQHRKELILSEAALFWYDWWNVVKLIFKFNQFV